MTAEGEACVRHVCFAFTPLAQLCALSFFPEHRNTADALRPTPGQSAGAPTSPRCERDALSVLSPSLMITHVCWIWAGEKTRCRFGALEGQLLRQQMRQPVSNQLRAPSAVSREQNKVAVCFKAGCLVFVTAPGELLCLRHPWKQRQNMHILENGSPTSIFSITLEALFRVRKSGGG